MNELRLYMLMLGPSRSRKDGAKALVTELLKQLKDGVE